MSGDENELLTGDGDVGDLGVLSIDGVIDKGTSGICEIPELEFDAFLMSLMLCDS